MAALMKVLEIKGIIFDLLNRIAIKMRRANFEFDNEYVAIDDKDRIGSLSHAGD